MERLGVTWTPSIQFMVFFDSRRIHNFPKLQGGIGGNPTQVVEFPTINYLIYWIEIVVSRVSTPGNNEVYALLVKSAAGLGRIKSSSEPMGQAGATS